MAKENPPIESEPTEAEGRLSPHKYLDPEVLMRMGGFNLLARRVVEGFISGLHKSPHHGFSVEFSEHREYTPGDDPRYLDWVALARSDRYYIKQFEQETNLRATIVLDCSGSMDYRGSDQALTKLQYGSFLAATLAYLMTRQQDAVGLVLFDTEVRLNMPPGQSAVHLNEMCRRLETIVPGGETNIISTFHQLAETIKRRGLVIILSDLYDEQKEVLRAALHFRHKRHEVIIFQILDRAELELPFTRLMDFRDLETGHHLQVEPRDIREAYVRELQDFIDGYRRNFVESGAEFVLTDTTVPYDFLLRAYLARRQKLS
ncbi:MAG: DUF58 domain-containing protein [Anaerolineaceae bacterium]|nr:DUF58 domain-containing protein [Anaerolineaceae bacterium]